MDIENINEENISAYAEVIPEEYISDVGKGNLFAMGGLFNDVPAGALVWEKGGDDSVIIKSLFVLPEYRRLGVATMLMTSLRGKIISFSYVATMDRGYLEPFFNAIGIETEQVDYPACRITLKQADARFAEGILDEVKETGSLYNELSVADKKVVSDWLMNEFGQNVQDYANPKVPSGFFVENNRVLGCLLLRETEKEHIDLEYLYCDPVKKKEMFGLIKKLIREVGETHKNKTVIEVVLTTEDGQRFYDKMFSAASDISRDCVCMISAKEQQIDFKLMRI